MAIIREKIINKATGILAKADTGTVACNNYNLGYLDGINFALKELEKELGDTKTPQTPLRS
jgi:hypothetical protein